MKPLLTFQSHDALMRDLSAPMVDVEIVTTGTTAFSTESNVFDLAESELFPDEVRVYFLNMYPVHARRIMCRVRGRQARTHTHAHTHTHTHTHTLTHHVCTTSCLINDTHSYIGCCQSANEPQS